MTLDRDAAARAIERSVARSRSGSHSRRRASAILQVANANMADAVRLISIRRGYDPREFALVVFGGRRARCTAPRSRASCRSRPCSCRPTRASRRRSAACSSTCGTTSRRCSSRAPTGVDPADARGRRSPRSRPRRASDSSTEGVPEARMSLQRFLDMRYLGQWRSMSIPVGAPLDARRRRRRPSTRSTSASTTTGATTRRSRSTG